MYYMTLQYLSSYLNKRNENICLYKNLYVFAEEIFRTNFYLYWQNKTNTIIKLKSVNKS